MVEHIGRRYKTLWNFIMGLMERNNYSVGPILRQSVTAHAFRDSQK